MALRYYTGRGSSRWQDRRNWASRKGGTGGAAAPTFADTIVLDESAPTGRDVDLAGCPNRGVTVRGFRGTVTLPDGGTINFSAGE